MTQNQDKYTFPDSVRLEDFEEVETEIKSFAKLENTEVRGFYVGTKEVMINNRSTKIHKFLLKEGNEKKVLQLYGFVMLDQALEDVVQDTYVIMNYTGLEETEMGKRHTVIVHKRKKQ